jgi:beta-glucanase (GH16 family)
MPGNWGLIDLDTPKEAYTKRSWADPSQIMRLVFSDEFNTDGRSFYPGDDPYWEAVDLHYWVGFSFAIPPHITLLITSLKGTNDMEWYDPSAITTANGSLVITLSAKLTHDLDYQSGTFWTRLSGE